MRSVPNADFAPLEQLAEHRQELWSRQREYVVTRSDLYRELCQGYDVPDGLEDLPSLPLVDKEVLRASQRAFPPFGAYLAADPAAVLRVHRTGGTTGEAMNLALSEADALDTAEIGARAQRASGLGPGDVVIHCLNYQLWMGGYTDHTTLEATGATVVPFGVGNPHLLVRTIRELGVTAISCTPSYPAVLEQVLAEQGVDPRDLGLRLGLFGGEAALDVPGFRARLEQTWGFAARNSNYGVTDIMCNFAGQCEAQDALHFMALDVLHPELIDDRGDVIGWDAGATGELVLTHVARDCQPLVRFRTGDIVTIEATDPCACGRTAPRFRVTGRADDMVVVRGVNVFPTSVAALVTSDPALSGEYRITLDGPGPYDRLRLEVERARDCGEADDVIRERIEAAARADLRVTADVRVLDFGALPRTEGKTRRVIRT
ncbi:MAG: phenylacetate--CoA ligase family protein [Candidatus Nanopelagicales bacterium]